MAISVEGIAIKGCIIELWAKPITTIKIRKMKSFFSYYFMNFSYFKILKLICPIRELRGREQRWLISYFRN